jgi:branched-chain amino acid transport system substrate-binding protein
VEAAAELDALKQEQFHCQRVAVGHDDDIDGEGVAGLIEAQRAWYGVNIVSDEAVPRPPGFAAWLGSLKRAKVDCVVYAGGVADGRTVAAEVHAELPKAKILGSDGVCTRSWVTGLPPGIDKYLWCTAPAPELSASPAGRAFLAAYKAAYRVSNPDPAAVYGYEAMKLGLDTIANLGASGDIKADVLAALFATRGRSSPIGTYGFNSDGDVTLNSYGLYQFEHGTPVHSQQITPLRVL